MRRTWSLLILATLLVLSACAPVGIGSGTRVITGGDYVLRSGETYQGSLLILGGNATLQDGSQVNGNINVIGGNTNANGEIAGDLSLIGGNVNLGPTALVSGSVMVRGGNVNRSPQARVLGSYTVGEGFDMPIAVPWFDVSPWGQLGWLVFRTLAQAALAMLVFLIFPAQLNRTASTIVQQPIASGFVGLLTMVLTPVLVVALALTIILIPISLIVGIVVMAAVFFGWSAIGAETGRRLDAALNLHLPPVLAIGLGMWLFGLVVGSIELIPFVGWLASFVVTMLAIGAAVLTRFGARTYTPPTALPMPPTLPQGSSAA